MIEHAFRACSYSARLWLKLLIGLCMFVFVTVSESMLAVEPAPARTLSINKIWDAAPHNAFTDLLWHNGKFICVFREGTAHVSPDGALRIITSPDGQKWTSAALIKSSTSDLRDAKITLAPDGRLMLCGAGALHDKSKATHQSLAWYSKDGIDWGEAIEIGDPDFWIWRVTWNGPTAYGVGYATGGSLRETRLYRSTDGRRFEAFVQPLTSDGYPNESTLLFTDPDKALCLARREQGDKLAWLGSSLDPLEKWSWKPLNAQVGGPNLIQLTDGRIVVAGRRYPGGAKTQLWWLDPERAELTEIATLPSGGDTSYPGLVYRNDVLSVSYYSSHEGKTNIYFAQLQLPPAETK